MNGCYKILRALPVAIAHQLVHEEKDAALAKLRQEVADLARDFEMMDQIVDGAIEEGAFDE